MKNIKWKEFLLEKGERVGLIAAGVLVVLLLFMTRKSLFSGSAKGHAAELKKLSDDLAQKQDRARPQKQHEPGPVADVAKSYEVKKVNPEKFPTLVAFYSPPEKDTKRQRPDVLVVEESRVGFVRAQIPRIQFEVDDEGNPIKLYVYKGGDGDSGQPSGPPGMPPVGGDLAKFAGKGYGPPQGGGPPPGMGGQGANLLRTAYGRRGRKPVDLRDRIEMVSIADAAQRVPATVALGMRMVIVEASFPYKKQVDEFMQKLRLANHGAVLSELVKGTDKDGKPTSWSSFQFRGLLVERTTLDRDGKEVRWEPLDVETPYRLLALQLRPQDRFEKEDPKLEPILAVSRGLVQKLPKQYKGKSYPKLEEQLAGIQQTLKKLAGTGKKEVIKPSLLDKGFNSFDLGGSGQQAGGQETAPMVPADGGTGYGNIPGTSDLKETSISSCLIRFLDLGIEPGKTYKYRIKVKMANPNYSPVPGERKDTYPHFAKPEELVAAGWAATPSVTIPGDDFLYAVDQAHVPPKLKVGFNNQPSADQAVFQIQRWVDAYRPPEGGDPQGIGDWLVATRFFVNRGEFVKTPSFYAIEVPVHALNNPLLSLLTRPVKRGSPDRIPIPFGDDSLLIDFEDKAEHKRVETDGEKTKPINLRQKIATEVLIMTPDGKMIARNSADDAKDPKRTARYKDYLKRVDDAKNPKKADSGSKIE